MSNILNTIILMGPPQEGQSPLMSFLPLVLIIVVFYFFMIRPQVKKQKELRDFREAINKGDSVLTVGGIYGKVVEVREQAVILEIDKDVKVTVDKTAVVKDITSLPQAR